MFVYYGCVASIFIDVKGRLLLLRDEFVDMVDEDEEAVATLFVN